MSTTALLTIAGILWVIVASVVILLQRRSAASTMAWILALSFMPIVGLLIYRLIGPMRLEKKRLRRSAGRKIVGEAIDTLAQLSRQSTEHAQLARVAMALGEPAPLHADEVELFLDGRATYASIMAAISAARHHVHIEYYIWMPDTIGTRLRDLLVEKEKAGVHVRIVFDAMGSGKLSKAFLAPLLAAGVEVAFFNRVRLRKLHLRRPDFRTHRKIVICDGRVGFTGGINVTDAHSQEFGENYWRDTHLRITGPAVWALQRLFLDNWYFAAEKLPNVDASLFPSPPEKPGPHIVQVVGSGPDAIEFPIHKTVFTAIGQAQERLWLTTPYFVPDDAVLTAIIAAALRKVDVRLIVPQKGDSRLVDMAARSYFPELLRAGVRIYEYGPRFIHAKTMVVDDDIAVVGTANLDNRSFRLNFELVAVTYGGPINPALAAAFEQDLVHATPIAARGRPLPFWTRLGQAGARLLSPLL